MRDCTIFTVCRCVYRQYVFGHEYGGAKVETDAAPREKEEPGGGQPFLHRDEGGRHVDQRRRQQGPGDRPPREESQRRQERGHEHLGPLPLFLPHLDR